MSFLQLSQKSEYQSLGETVAKFYHHSQGGSLQEFKRHCYELLNEMIPLGPCFWVVEQDHQTISALDFMASQTSNLSLERSLSKLWQATQLQTPEQTWVALKPSSIKDLDRELLVGHWCIEQQGVSHHFGFSPQNPHLPFTPGQMELLQSVVPHLMEAFRLHCLAEHRVSLNSQNFYFGVCEKSGRFIEVDEGFAPIIELHKAELLCVMNTAKKGEKPFVKLTEKGVAILLRLEGLLDVVFCQAMNLPPECSTLTNKELEVCFYLKQMMPNQKIADEMNISPKTVENHLANIYEKLGGLSRSELLVKLLKQKRRHLAP